MVLTMLRLVAGAIRGGTKVLAETAAPLAISNYTGIVSRQVRCLSVLTKQPNLSIQQTQWSDSLKEKSNPVSSVVSSSLSSLLISQVRFSGHRKVKKGKLVIPPKNKVVLFSLKNGKRITNKEVVNRFYRLNWGMWIRTIAGRNKHLWRKTPARRKRAKQHVFTNSTQSHMLDKMVTKFWKRPKFYVDDPYEPYHTREEHFRSQRKPLPLPEEL